MLTIVTAAGACTGIIHGALGYSMRNGKITFAPNKWTTAFLFITADCYGIYETHEYYNVLRVVSGTLKANILKFAVPCETEKEWSVQIYGITPEVKTANGMLKATFLHEPELP